MISKKNLAFIEDFIAKHDKHIRDELETKVSAPCVYTTNDEDMTKATIKCYHCGHEGIVDISKKTSCPICGEELMVEGNKQFFYNHLIEIPNGFVVMVYDCLSTFSIKEKTVKADLTDIIRFEDNVLDCFYCPNNTNDWTKKVNQSTRWYYGYDCKTNVTKAMEERLKAEYNNLLKNASTRHYYYSSSVGIFDAPSVGYRLNEAYKNAIRSGEITKTVKRKKVDKTPSITIPKMNTKGLTRIAPLSAKIIVTKKGLVNMAQCGFCGTEYPVQSIYSVPNCPCCGRKNMTSDITGTGIATYNNPDNFMMVAYDYRLKPIDETAKDIVYGVDTVKAKAAIYANEDGIFFYEVSEGKAKKASCADINYSFGHRRYGANDTGFVVGGYKKVVEDFESSIIGKCGYMEYCKSIIEDLDIDEDDDESYAELAHNLIAKINYLNIYNNAPAVEQLIKSGMVKFVDDMATKISWPKNLKRKEATPAKIMSLSKSQFREVREENISQDQYDRYRQILEVEPDAAYADCKRFVMSYGGPEVVLEILGLGIKKINMKEIEKYAQSLDEYQCMDWSEGLRLWRDYLRMCQELKCDMEDRTVLFTTSLKLDHDRAVRKHNNVKNPKAVKNFEEAVKRYAHYEWEDEDQPYIVITPKSQEALYEEGRILHHCVGIYTKSIASGNSIVLLVRSKDDPNTPLCTVEVEKGQVVQARGKYNNSASSIPGMAKFLKAWCKEKKLVFSRF